MRRQIRMTAFHVRQFVSVPYFIQVMVVATLTTTLVQYLAFNAWHGVTPTVVWVRGGVIGLWSTATCAAGIIGFERYKGTLVHLVLAPVGALRSLAAVVSAAASFGVLALPLSWATWSLLSWSVHAPSWRRLAGVTAGTLMLWLGAVALSLAVAALFVLTPNAISYEGLLLVPVFLLSGLTFLGSGAPGWLQPLSRLLPVGLPVQVLLGGPVSVSALAGWTCSTLAWAALAGLLGRAALVRATRTGTLEVV